MEFQERWLDGFNLLEARGDADHAAVDDFAAAVDGFLGPGNWPVFIDLSGCELMDSGGLSVMLVVLRRAKAAGSWLGVVGLNQDLRRLFEIAGFVVDPAFRLFQTPVEAAAALKSPEGS